ncbi:MAG TPA: hypothetical protein VK084_09610 [Chitinophagaceae bacterium]|nr:hypothetical protein [Chitinophagaceae bacterium]
MHFQVIKDEYFSDIINHLKKRVPEFVSVFNDDKLIYPIIGEFGQFFIDNREKEALFYKSISFINESLKLGKGDTEDVIVLQVFQKIYESPRFIDKVRQSLEGQAKRIFEKYLQEYLKGT